MFNPDFPFTEMHLCFKQNKKVELVHDMSKTLKDYGIVQNSKLIFKAKKQTNTKKDIESLDLI